MIILKLINSAKLTKHYYICKTEFSSNNYLYWHIKKDCQWNDLISEFKLKLAYSNHVNAELTEIINSNIMKFSKQSFDFQTYYYTTVNIQLSSEDSVMLICMNSDCLTTLINRAFLLKHLFNVNIERSEALFAV